MRGEIAQIEALRHQDLSNFTTQLNEAQRDSTALETKLKASETP